MGQQIAFIIIIVLSGMILTQLFIFRSEFRSKFELISNKLSEIESKINNKL